MTIHLFDAELLEDVVVVGYMPPPRSDQYLTSVVKVSAAKIQNQPAAFSPMDALSGKVAGVANIFLHRASLRHSSLWHCMATVR